MKPYKITLLTIFLALGITAGAESPSTTTHIVDRGETIEYIARKYGVTVADIQKVNEWADVIYCGLELIIPLSERDSRLITSTQNPLFAEAQRYIDKEDYGKAIKIYNKILKDDSFNLTAIYNRGICYYNKGKMKQATEDFSYVKLHDEKGDFPDAKKLAENARSIQEEKNARRAEMWGAIFSTVANATTMALQTNAINTTTKTVPNTGYANNSSLSYQQTWNNYLNPAAFVYNYTHGLPTLPNSAQLGLSGSDAYDLQNKLQYQSQLMDLEAQENTKRLVAEGRKRAQDEINNFSAIYGREPTPQEIDAIYSKHTQGYIDAYSTYVKETTSNSNELSSYNRTEDTSKNSKSNETKDNKVKENKSNDITSTKNSGASEKSKTTGIESENSYARHGRFIQRRVNLHLSHAPYDRTIVFHNCEVYQKGLQYYIKIGDSFYNAIKSTDGHYKYKIIHGSTEYYFNI